MHVRFFLIGIVGRKMNYGQGKACRKILALPERIWVEKHANPKLISRCPRGWEFST
jgi:hypothetical protein